MKPGVEFEEAVYRFAKALDPSAEVIFNHHVLDRDTGTARQCDVWINAKFAGHWPLSILVSCKDHSTKLDIGDIGAFRDEVRSTGASTGVIYSRAGFTGPALEKAAANGLACCRLYQNEPADIPTVIFFDQFLCIPTVTLISSGRIIKEKFKTWGDLFSIKQNEFTALDLICAAFAQGEQRAADEAAKDFSFPPDTEGEAVLTGEGIESELRVRVVGKWRRFRARLEAIFLDGSYCLSNESFNGTITSPSIDTFSDHPGDGWLEITGEADTTFPSNRALTVLYGGDVRKRLQESMAHLAL